MGECPYLKDGSDINVNYLPDEIKEYSIDSIPSSTVIKEYVDGGKVKQYVFTFASKETYGPDVLQNIQNSGFYENIAGWIEMKSDEHQLPNIDGKQVMYLEVTDSGYLYQSETDKARYQMQLRLVYYED